MHFIRLLRTALSIAAFTSGCANNPTHADSPPTATAGATEYEDIAFKVLLMTKPSGKYVRTAGAWGDVQPNVPGIGPDAFGVYFYDNASILALSVPKALAERAARFAHGEAVTVEGRFEDRAPFPIVHVDRFVEVVP